MTATEPLIRLTDVPKLPWLPARRGGGRLNLCTLWRWALKGLKARDGARIKLQTLRVGETLCTTEGWLRQFFESLTAHDPELANETGPSPVRTLTQRQRAADRAAAELDKIGI
jgi:hypothetical protein